MDDQRKAELERLGKEARSEIEAYHGLLRRAGIHLFRAGRALFGAKSLIKEAGATWADWLRQEQIADSTARQAIDLYRNAKAMGHEEIDLEGLTVTEAKIKYGIVAPKPKLGKGAKPTTSPPSSDEGTTNPPSTEQGDTPLPPSRHQGAKPPQDGDDTPPPAQGKGNSTRVKERSLLKLVEIFGEGPDERTINLPLATWSLLDILVRQEEVDEPGVIVSRAVREYWLRHGDPVQVSGIPAAPAYEPEPELVCSAVTA